MNCQAISKCSLVVIVFTVIGYQSPINAAVVNNEAIECAFDPKRGKPNPLGNRAFITVSEQGGDTHFRYVKFPTIVKTPDSAQSKKLRSVTVENRRALIFYNTPIEVARKLVRTHREYYYELIGYVDLAGFSSYDNVMSCE